MLENYMPKYLNRVDENTKALKFSIYEGVKKSKVINPTCICFTVS